MGDMAEMALNESYWVNGEWPEADGDDFVVRARTCRNCAETGLVWGKIQGRWRLFSASTKLLHKCPVRPLAQ